MSSLLYNQLKVNEKVDEIERIINLAKKQGEHDISYTFSECDPSYILNGVPSVLEDRGYYVKSYVWQERKIFIWWED